MSFTPINRKPSFRSKKKRKDDNMLIFFLSSIFCCALFTAHYAGATETNTPSAPPQTAYEQIQAHSIELATADINRIAKSQHWQQHEVKIHVYIPAEANLLALCQGGLQTPPYTEENLDFSRLRYDISCPDQPGWQVTVNVKPEVYVPIMVAKATIERGETITRDKVDFKKRNISNNGGNYITDPATAIGFTAKKRIRSMQIISPSQLEEAILVSRGQQVTMIALYNNIEARTVGEALKNGRKGETIKVRNLSSKKVVSATVEEAGVVKVIR